MKKKKKLFRRPALAPIKDATLNLPVSYKQMFKFAYRTNFTLLLKISIAISLFCLPLFIALYIRGVIITGITNNSTAEELSKNIMAFQAWYGFILLGCFLIASIGILGSFNVMKRFIRNEGVKFSRDFFSGIKNNYLPTLGTTFFYFGILSILNYILNLFSFKSDIPYYAILLVLFIFIQIFFFMAYTMNVMSIVIYKCPFFRNIKNMFLVLISKLPLCLLSLICGVGPLILVWAIGYVPVLFGFLIAYICLGFGNAVLVAALFTMYSFDECINKRQFPDYYRMGLFNGEQVQPIDEGFHK